MIITWYGQSCFRIQSRDLTLAIDPFSKEIGLTPPRFNADILLISHNHPDHNNQEALTGSPFLISGPGEYEIKGIYITGIASFHDNKSGEQYGLNTIYLLESEEIKICHLGDFGERGLRPEIQEKITSPDILMIPIGGKTTIGPKEALNIIHQLRPKIAIPMHYKISNLKMNLEGLGLFLKEAGQKEIAPQEKLTIKKKDLLEKKTQIFIFSNP